MTKFMKKGLLSCILVFWGCGAHSPEEEGWLTASAEEVDLQPEVMDHLRKEVEEGSFENLHGLIVVRRGKLAFETYAPGHKSEDLHYVASVTKSIGALLLGIAMDQGLFPAIRDGALDLSIEELFPQSKPWVDGSPNKQAIRLGHILSMTAGLAWDEDSHPYDDPRNDWVRVRDQADPVKAVLSTPAEAVPGAEFVYSGGCSALLGALLERVTGDPHEFAREAFFGPLGIHEFEWQDLASGVLDVPGGLHLRPRDMAKIGQMMLDHGLWRGRRIVSEDWVHESCNMKVENSFGPGYGLHWWVGDYQFRGESVFMYLASGHGGQRILVIPELEMVVVIVQQVFNNPMADANNLSILTQFLLPAANLLGEEQPWNPADPFELHLYEGDYRTERGNFQIEIRSEKLWALAENAPPLELRLVGKDRFRGTAFGRIEIDFQFRRNSTGEVTGGKSSYGFTQESFHRLLSED